MKKAVIPISKETRTRLEKLGHMYSDYEEILQEILMHIETCNVFWEDRN